MVGGGGGYLKTHTVCIKKYEIGNLVEQLLNKPPIVARTVASILVTQLLKIVICLLAVYLLQNVNYALFVNCDSIGFIFRATLCLNFLKNYFLEMVYGLWKNLIYTLVGLRTRYLNFIIKIDKYLWLTL